MSNRLATALWATATVVAFLPVTPAPAAGQGQTAETAASTPPRTGWGQPDLRGMWDFRTLTPLQRPGRMADKEFLTDEEAALFVQRTLQERDKDRRYENARLDVEFAYNQFWWDYGTTITDDKRSALIVDPPDGQMPPLTREALMTWEAREQARSVRSQADDWEDRGLSERCITRNGLPGEMLGSGQQPLKEIVQTPGYVSIVMPYGYVRIIPVNSVNEDEPAPLGSAIRQWNGDSRGRWEGDTLVVTKLDRLGRSVTDLNAIDLEGAKLQVAGTARSMGIAVG